MRLCSTLWNFTRENSVAQLTFKYTLKDIFDSCGVWEGIAVRVIAYVSIWKDLMEDVGRMPPKSRSSLIKIRRIVAGRGPVQQVSREHTQLKQ